MNYFDHRSEVMLKLGLPEVALAPLKAYVETLWDANQQLNLISRKMKFEELIDNHVIDCLLPLGHFPQESKVVADFGSGGGLPGVVYAIAFPEKSFRLYENGRLKQEFLNHCKQIAPNMTVLGNVPEQLGQIDLIVSRAFKPIDVILNMTKAYHDKGGRYFLLKARREKIDEELSSARKLFPGLMASILPLESPVLEVERHLVLIN